MLNVFFAEQGSNPNEFNPLKKNNKNYYNGIIKKTKRKKPKSVFNVFLKVTISLSTRIVALGIILLKKWQLLMVARVR